MNRLSRLVSAILFILAQGLSAQETAEKGIVTLEGHGAHVHQARYTRKGDLVASVSHDRTVRLWSASDGHEIAAMKIDDSQLWTVAIAPDGRHLAAAGDFVVRVWALPSKPKAGKALKKVIDLPIDGEMGAGKGTCMALGFSPDSKWLMVGTMNSKIQCFQVKGWKDGDALVGHEGCDGMPGFIEFLDFSADGRMLVTGGKTPATRVWSRDRRGHWKCAKVIEEKKREDGHPTHRMMARFSPDGSMLALGGTDGILRVFATEDWKVLHDERCHPGEFITAIAFSTDGQTLHSAGKSLRVHDTKTWKSRDLPALSKEGVTWLESAPDGRRLLEVGRDFRIRVRALEAGSD